MSGRDIDYEIDGATFSGYLALPDNPDSVRGGVLLIHEWWGLNDYMRGRADMVAGLNCAALAVDMYGSGKRAEDPDGAMTLMTEALTAARDRGAELGKG